MCGYRSGIAGFVLPGLEVHDLRSADTEDDLKDFQAAGFLRHRRIEAGAALLDKRKVKSRREGDHLDVIARIIWVVTTEIGNVSGNRGVETRSQARDCVREGCTEIGIGRAAVAGPPTGIHGELREICQPSDFAGAGRRTARQGAKRIQIDTSLAFGVEICIEEINVALFIVGIVGDILRLVAIENFKRTYVAGRRRIDSSEFGVLLPKVRLDNFCGSEESQDGRVSVRDLIVIPECLTRTAQKCGTGCQKRRAKTETAEKRSPPDAIRR